MRHHAKVRDTKGHSYLRVSEYILCSVRPRIWRTATDGVDSAVLRGDRGRELRAKSPKWRAVPGRDLRPVVFRRSLARSFILCSLLLSCFYTNVFSSSRPHTMVGTLQVGSRWCYHLLPPSFSQPGRGIGQ